MTADAHAHSWPVWPYPDAGPPCDTDALLHALDANGVDRTLVIAARLEGQADNNEYVQNAARQHPDRLWAAVEVGAFFARPSPDIGAQLSRLIDAGPVAAVALFPDPSTPGWLTDEPGRTVLDLAATHGLVVSVAAPPPLQPELRVVASDYPSLTFLMHHAGMIDLAVPAGLAEVLRTATSPNVHVKLSGLHYAGTDAPALARDLIDPLVAAYGPHRLLWGSDFPAAARRSVDYPRSLSEVRQFIAPGDQPAVFGGTLEGLLSSP